MNASHRLIYLRGVRMREEVSQGLDADFLGPQMSEIKLRPPEKSKMRGRGKKEARG